MYLFCNSRIHVITLYSGHVCVCYASMLRCWHLIWILVRTDHLCLGVGHHTVTHNRECRGDSNQCTYPAGKEPDQHVIRLTPGGSHVWQPFAKSLLHWNRSPIHRWSLGHWSHSSSHNIIKAGVRFSKVVTWLLGLPDPIKTWHVVSTQLIAYHRGQNGVFLNWNRRGLPHRNLRIATTLSPPFPSVCSTDPPTCPTWSSNSE
jgi:hypothetical protein